MINDLIKHALEKEIERSVWDMYLAFQPHIKEPLKFEDMVRKAKSKSFTIKKSDDEIRNEIYAVINASKEVES